MVEIRAQLLIQKKVGVKWHKGHIIKKLYKFKGREKSLGQGLQAVNVGPCLCPRDCLGSITVRQPE